MRNYIDANNIAKISDEVIAKYLRISMDQPGAALRIKKAKNTLEHRLRSYVSDCIQNGVIEPNARTQAIVNQGTQVGTWSRELQRSIMQFKQYPVAILTQIVGPWLGVASKGEAAKGLTELILMTTALGYISICCKDILRGKTAPEMSPKVAIRSLLQGGAFGIMGDLLFTEAMSDSLIKDLAGPVAGTIDDAYRIYTQATIKIIFPPNLVVDNNADLFYFLN